MRLHYQSLTLDELVDLLSDETQKLTQLISSKNMNAEYDFTKELIKDLQQAIEQKRLGLKNISITNAQSTEEPANYVQASSK
jgi:hypothetical protein